MHWFLSLQLYLSQKDTFQQLIPRLWTLNTALHAWIWLMLLIKYTNHQNETQNLSKKIQIITHPSTLQSAIEIPTHNTNPWTTIQPVHSNLTTTNWHLGGCVFAAYWQESIQQKDSECDCGHGAKPHHPQQQLSARIPQWDHKPISGWLQGITTARWSFVRSSFRTIGSLLSFPGISLNIHSLSQNLCLIPPQCCRSYPRLHVGGCYPGQGSCDQHS